MRFLHHLVNEEYLDYGEYEDKNITDEEFVKILKHETDNWKYNNIDKICKKYNSGYDCKKFFVKIDKVTFEK